MTSLAKRGTFGDPSRASDARAAPRDGAIAVPRGARAPGDRALLEAPREARWPHADLGRRPHRACSARSARPRSRAGRGDRGDEAAMATPVAVPDRELGGGLRDPVGDPSDVPGAVGGPVHGSWKGESYQVVPATL